MCFMLLLIFDLKKIKKRKKIQKENTKIQKNTYEESQKIAHISGDGPKWQEEKLVTQFWFIKDPFGENIFLG